MLASGERSRDFSSARDKNLAYWFKPTIDSHKRLVSRVHTGLILARGSGELS